MNGDAISSVSSSVSGRVSGRVSGTAHSNQSSIEGSVALHRDRLFPADPTEREIARNIYDAVRGLPLISPHGHVDARLLAENEPFSDPASLLVTPDHYVTRLLHADGVDLSALGLGRDREPLSESESRKAWRLLCERWHLFRGTPVRLWLETELSEIFHVSTTPSAATADAIYDEVAKCLADLEFRPRALFERFDIAVLATTDDPCADLAWHAALRADPGWHGRVVPTFRPDRYLDPSMPGWQQDMSRLAEAADRETGDYAGYLIALESRRRHFISNGATSSDHSHRDVRTEPISIEEAQRIYRLALDGEATDPEAEAFRNHMLLEMARMSCEDGLVMTLHPGVSRNHHRATYARFGADTGHDIPVAVEFTEALHPLLERYGTYRGFHLVLFTLDETVWSRELAPLAGFYPSVYLGVPWWFLDAPAAIKRFYSAVTETTGFSRLSGFVDDTRAFCSIPARHDMSRRLDASFLAGLVREHRLGERDAVETAVALAGRQPTKVFKL